ncbi:MAG: sodium:solute symporter family protein [Planctomycetota bacterium]|nr:sodium:solute symporter family protein [Planctomycetota bacterium]
MQLHPIDAIVLVLYLLGITLLGSWMGRRISSAAEFFMPRRFGKATMIMHAFGTGTASDQAVTVASATAKNGLSGIWFQWMWLFSTPFYWLIAPLMRRFRAVTTADIYELRFDRSVSVLFAVVGIASMAVKIGVMLKGAGALIDAGTGGMIDANLAIPVLTLMFVLYGVAGGLGGAIMTDFFQGIMTIIFSFMLLPVVMYEIGGFTGMKEIIGQANLDRDMLSLVAPGNVGVFFIVMVSINALFLIVSVPSVMGNCAAGKTELDGRIGFMFGTFIKRVCTIAWCLTAIAAVAWYLKSGIQLKDIDPDKVYGDMAYRFLPQLVPGMLGIFIASLLAAVMSSCDSFMIASSGLFTKNIYQVACPDRTAGHYVWVGRLAAFCVVILGVAFSYLTKDVIAGLKIWYKVGPMIGIAFWLGLLWRRTTVAGAWASTLTGFATWFLITRPWFVDWVKSLSFAEPLHLVVSNKQQEVIYDPWQILLYLSAGTLAGIVVSLLTRPVCRERLNRFYDLTITPVESGEIIGEPCQLPDGNSPPERAMLLTSFGLEIPRPSRLSILGFLLGWVFVGGIIGGFVWLVS